MQYCNTNKSTTCLDSQDTFKRLLAMFDIDV